MKIRKRKDGRYTTQVKTPDGKYKSVYGKTKTELMDKARALIKEIESGEYIKSSTVPVQLWTQEWLDNYLVNVTESTKISYSQYVKLDINVFFKDKKIRDISHGDVQRFVKFLSEERHLNPSTIRTCLTVFKRCMNDAIKEGLILKNPADNVAIPKQKQDSMQPLTAKECTKFIKLSHELTDYGDVIEFLLLTGIRINELRGLKPEDYNREDHSLLIQRQVSKTGELVPPKSGKPRKIYLVTRAIEIIEKQINPDDLMIFSGKKGDFVGYTSIRMALKKVAEAIGRPDFRIHDLRHTYATLSLQAGMDIKTLQENLGHHDPGFTLRRYGHSTDEMKIKGSEKFEGFLNELQYW